MTTRMLTVLAIVTALAVSFAAPLGAQEEGAPTWVAVTYVTVNPEKDTAFQDLIKNHWLPAMKKTDGPDVNTWRTAQFGDAFEYSFVSTIPDFAHYDGEPPLMKVMKADEYAILYERLRECVSSVRSVAYLVRMDAGYDNLDGAAPKMAVVSRTRVKTGKHEAYAKLVKEQYLPHFQKLGFPALYSMQTVFGGSGNEWLHVTVIENFAELDKGEPMVRAVGPEKAREISAMFDDIVEDDSMTLIARLPELSYNSQ